MFGENKEEINEISKKDLKEIGSDMLTEMIKTENIRKGEGKKQDESNIKMDTSSIDLGGASQSFQKVPIPKEIFQPSYTMVCDFINGYRLKKVPPKHIERAKEILAPTEKEIELGADLTGYLVGYFEKKYGSNILNSPWIGPIMIMGKFGLVQLEKEKALRTYLSIASVEKGAA